MTGTVRRTPFTVADETLLRLDRPEEPQTVHFEIRVAGSLEEGRLREAVKEAVARHPMARVSKAADRQLLRPPLWQVHDPDQLDVDRVVTVAHADGDSAVDEARAAFYSQRVDVTQPPPLRLQLVTRPGGDTILVTFNHAVSDGIGAFRFLKSVAGAYSGRSEPMAGDEVELRLRRLPPPEPRDEPPPPPRRPGSGRAGPASVVAASPGGGGPGYGFHQSILTGLPLRSRGRAEGGPRVTVNDVLMGAVHQSIAEWNRARGEPCGRLLVLLPMNLRPEAMRLEIVGNCVASCMVGTDEEDRRDPERLLETIGAQTRAAKAGGAAATHRRSARLQHVAPLLLPLFRLPSVRSRWQTAANLTNLGNLGGTLAFAPPDSEPSPMTECWAAAPNLMPAGLSVGAVSVDDRLCLILRYRRQLFDAAAAADFAALYEQEFVRLLAARAARDR